MLSQEFHDNIMPMLPSEETLLIIANVVRKAQLQSQPRNQNKLVPNLSLTKEQKGILTYGHC